MSGPNIRQSRSLIDVVFAVITIVPGALLAAVFLLVIVLLILNLHTRPGPLGEYILVATFILAAVVQIYALFRPYSGGFCMCICAVLFGFIHPLWHGIAGFLLAIGVISVIRGRHFRRKASEDPEQAS